MQTDMLSGRKCSEHHHGRRSCPAVTSGVYKKPACCVGSNRSSDDVPRTASAETSIFPLLQG